MHTNILVVYKKNFEEVHDMALATIRQALDDLCLLYTSPSPRDAHESRMPSSA